MWSAACSAWLSAQEKNPTKPLWLLVNTDRKSRAEHHCTHSSSSSSRCLSPLPIIGISSFPRSALLSPFHLHLLSPPLSLLLFFMASVLSLVLRLSLLGTWCVSSMIYSDAEIGTGRLRCGQNALCLSSNGCVYLLQSLLMQMSFPRANESRFYFFIWGNCINSGQSVTLFLHGCLLTSKTRV